MSITQVVQKAKARISAVLRRSDADAQAALVGNALIPSPARGSGMQKTVAYVASLVVSVVLARHGYDANGVASVIGVSALFASQINNK